MNFMAEKEEYYLNSIQNNAKEIKLPPPNLRKTYSVEVHSDSFSDFSEEKQKLQTEIKTYLDRQQYLDDDEFFGDKINEKCNEIQADIEREFKKKKKTFLSFDQIHGFIQQFSQNELVFPNDIPLNDDVKQLFNDFYHKLDKNTMLLEDLPSDLGNLLDKYAENNQFLDQSIIINELKGNIQQYQQKKEEELKNQEQQQLNKVLTEARNDLLIKYFKDLAQQNKEKIKDFTNLNLTAKLSLDESTPRSPTLQGEEKKPPKKLGFLNKIKEGMVAKFIDEQLEREKQVQTTQSLSQQIVQKSIQGLSELFYDDFRNKAYFSQQDMIQAMQQNFGKGILDVQQFDDQHKKFIKDKFYQFYSDAESKFLADEISKGLQKDGQLKLLDIVDENFNKLKERLQKLKKIADQQQIQITEQDVFDQANEKLDNILKCILTEQDFSFNKMLLDLSKLLQKYKKQDMNQSTRKSITKKININEVDEIEEQGQVFKQKVNNITLEIENKIKEIKSDLKTYLKEDMRKGLSQKIKDWKQSRQEKLERMNQKKLTSQNMWFTLIWHDSNDLDLNVKCPCGSHIFYGTKKCERCGTFLQLDMNAGKNQDDKFPIEHIYLLKPPKVGAKYEVYCKLFTQRNGMDSQFTLQIEHEDGRIVSFQGILNEQKKESQHYVYTVPVKLDEKQRKLGDMIRNLIETY